MADHASRNGSEHSLISKGEVFLSTGKEVESDVELANDIG